MALKAYVHQCRRCNHEWISKMAKPRICPKCKSPYWDIPRSYPKGQGKAHHTGVVADELATTADLLAAAFKRNGAGVLNLLGPALTEQERCILYLRFGIDGQPARTLEQIGQVLNVTRQCVHDHESRALSKIGERIADTLRPSAPRKRHKGNRRQTPATPVELLGIKLPASVFICDICGARLAKATKAKHFRARHPEFGFTHKYYDRLGTYATQCATCGAITGSFPKLVWHYHKHHRDVIGFAAAQMDTASGQPNDNSGCIGGNA